MASAGTLTALAVALPLAALSLGYSPTASAQHEHKGVGTLTDEQAIANSMRAAPEAVARDATIIVMEDGGNTDPYAEGPQPGNSWVSTGAHVMVVGAAKMMEGYPRDAIPDTTKPYIMWTG